MRTPIVVGFWALLLGLSLYGCGSDEQPAGQSGAAGAPAAGGSSGAGGASGAAGQAGKAGQGGSAGQGGTAGSGGVAGASGEGGAAGVGGAAGQAGNAGAAGSAAGAAGAAGSSAVSCPVSGSELTELPACQSPSSTNLDIPAGCEPNVDGVLHDAEWNDGICINVGDSSAPDMVLKLKFAGDNLYIANSGIPTCGCPFLFAFDPNHGASADGDEFGVGVYDDPFKKDGDRADFLLSGGAWSPGAAPAGIVTACPGNQPNPYRYEWKIPLSVLGITPGAAHAFGFAIGHVPAKWPDTAATVSPMGYPTDPAQWGVVSSSADWK